MHRLRDEEREEEGEGKSNFRSKDKKRGEEKRKEKETRKRNTFPFFAGLRAPRSRRLAFDECLIRNSKLGYSGFRRRIHGYKYVSRVVARPGILLSRRTCSISFPSFLFFFFLFFFGGGKERRKGLLFGIQTLSKIYLTHGKKYVLEIIFIYST